MENGQKIQRQKEFLIKAAYWGVLAAGLLAIFKFAGPVLLPFFIAFLIAWLLAGPTDFIAKKIHVKRKPVAAAVVILFYALLCVILYFAGSRLMFLIQDTFYDIADFFSETVFPLLEDFFGWLDQISGALYPVSDLNAVSGYAAGTSQGTFAAAGKADKVVSEISGNVISGVSTFAAVIPGFCMKVFIAVIATLFMALDFPAIKEFIRAQIPKNYQKLISEGKSYVTGTFLKCIISYALILVLTFVELWLGFLILKLDGAVIIALLIALLDILPILGTGTVLIPWAVISFAIGDTGMGTGILVLYLMILIVRNIVEPKLVGKQMGLSPVVMLPSMLLGLKLFGLIGLFVLPLTVAFLKALNEEGVIHIWNTADEVKKQEPFEQD